MRATVGSQRIDEQSAKDTIQHTFSTACGQSVNSSETEDIALVVGAMSRIATASKTPIERGKYFANSGSQATVSFFNCEFKKKKANHSCEARLVKERWEWAAKTRFITCLTGLVSWLTVLVDARRECEPVSWRCSAMPNLRPLQQTVCFVWLLEYGMVSGTWQCMLGMSVFVGRLWQNQFI